MTAVFVSAIIVAAGKGERLASDKPKQFMTLGHRPILAHTLARFQRCDAVSEIILVTRGEYVAFCREMFDGCAVVPGGETRRDSVAAGLRHCSPRADVILTHDGVRPFVSDADIRRVIGAARTYGAATLGAPAKDTIKICDDTQNIMRTLPRENIWHAQTPQGFRAALLREAYAPRDDRHEEPAATDDAVMLERLGHRVRVVRGSDLNIKITTPADLVLAGAILEHMG